MERNTTMFQLRTRHYDRLMSVQMMEYLSRLTHPHRHLRTMTRPPLKPTTRSHAPS